MVVSIVLIIIIFIIIGIVLYQVLCSRLQRMHLLQDHNIPGPTVHIVNMITGHMLEYNSTPNVIWDSIMIEKYGPICGYYIGAKPVILIADPELAKHIQQCEMKNFLARPRRVPGGINPDRMRAKMLGNLPVYEWRPLRKTLSKCFSTGMMKNFTPTISLLVVELMDQLNEQLNQQQHVELNIYPFFQTFTFELISQTGFGVHANFSGDSELKAAVEEEFSKNTSSFLTMLSLCFPEIPMLQRIRTYVQLYETKFVRKNSTLKLRNFCERALQTRKNGALIDGRDILKVLLDSAIKDDKEKVLANSILFYEAGYETLSAGLAFTMHLLTTNLIVQQNVREEIRKYLQENDGHVSADNISQLKYLDAVIKESLRMYPPQTTFISRSGETDFVYKRGEEIICTIPKGVQVQIGLYQMQNSPKFWDEPEVFKPERHLNEGQSPLHEYSYQPFGKGQRRCIGYSYAKLVMPLVLATILSKYTLSPSPKTEEKLTLLFKTATMTPKNGCFAEIKFDPIVL